MIKDFIAIILGFKSLNVFTASLLIFSGILYNDKEINAMVFVLILATLSFGMTLLMSYAEHRRCQFKKKVTTKKDK
jgi:hypothetical protein